MQSDYKSMMLSQNRRKAAFDGIAVIAVFSILFCLYLYSLAPTFTVADSGELISAACSLGIGHPPGYPTYVLIGKVFSLLPLGNVGFRLNLLSCTAALATVIFIFLLIKIMTERVPIALIGALFIGFSPLFYKYATVTEVFSLNAAFCAFLLLLLYLYEIHNNAKFLYLFSFVFGLGLGNQQTLIFLGLATVLFFITSQETRTFQFFIRITGWFCLGLSIYLFLLLRAYQSPTVNMGEKIGAIGFLRHVLRLDYGTLHLARIEVPASFRYAWIESWIYCKSLVSQFTWLGILLGMVGATATSIKYRFQRILLATFLLSSIGFQMIGRVAPTPVILDAMKRFYIMPDLVFTIWISLGINWLYERTPSKSWQAIILALTTIVLVRTGISTFNHETCRDDYVAYDYIDNILKTLPPKSLLLSSGMDSTDFGLMYTTTVMGKRPDITVRSIGVMFPPITTGIMRQIGQNKKAAYYAALWPEKIGSLNLYPAGILQKFINKDSLPIKRFPTWYIVRNPAVPENSIGYPEREILALYPYFRGFSALFSGRTSKALQEFNAASIVGGNVEWLDTNIGIICMDNHFNDLAVKYLKMSLTNNPYYLKAYLNLAFLYNRQGERNKALELARKAADLNPNSNDVRYALKILNTPVQEK